MTRFTIKFLDGTSEEIAASICTIGDTWLELHDDTGVIRMVRSNTIASIDRIERIDA
jgi:hypothetical protein